MLQFNTKKGTLYVAKVQFKLRPFGFLLVLQRTSLQQLQHDKMLSFCKRTDLCKRKDEISVVLFCTSSALERQKETKWSELHA